MDHVHKLLNLPDNVKVFSLFALGYPAGGKDHNQDRFDENRIHFIE